MSEDDFILHGQWLDCASSNVAAAMFDRENQLLFIRYNNGSTYQYLGVPETYAIDFFHAPSKGKWCWDNLRVRGTKDGSRFGFIKM